MVYVKYRTTEELFWRKVDKTPGHGPWGDCWIWTGARNKGTYGRFNDGTKVNNAHIYSHTLNKGPIPDGHHVDHLCENKPCVNPDHLEAVPPAENIRRHFRNRTHCRRGHKLNDVRVWRGIKTCKECIRLQQEAYRMGMKTKEMFG